mgnify:CR=1 FL=1
MEKDILENKKIAIIGAGHMGQAIIKGLISSGKIKPSNIFISNKLNNVAITKKAHYIFITVKPLTVKEVLHEIKPFIENKIILSVAAGVSLKMLLSYSNINQKIIRMMPNIPVSINKGVIGFFANKNVIYSEHNNVMQLITLLGKVFVVKKEADLDVLTLIAGCGPAISAYFINFLSNYAISQSFSQAKSIDMALKIFEGTTDYLMRSNLTPSELIKSVATKGGVTEVILDSLNAEKVDLLFKKAMKKGSNQIGQLKKVLKTCCQI